MKNLFYFIITICLFMFVSCSDDDNSDYSEQISKIYRDNELKLTMNGKELKNKVVKLHTNDLNSAELMIRYTIPGEDSLMITSVKMSPYIINESNPVYGLSGENIDSDRSIKIEGKLDRVLTIDITYETKSKIVGKWIPSTDQEKNMALSFNIVPSPGNDSINMYGILGYEKIPLVPKSGSSGTAFNEIISDMGIMIFSMIQLEFDFDKSGELTMYWGTPVPIIPLPSGHSRPDMVKYNVKDKYLYAAIAVDSLIIDQTTRSESSNADYLALIQLAQTAYKGLPFKLEFVNDDLIYVSADREMMLPYAKPLINVLKPKMKDLDLGLAGQIFGMDGETLAKFADEFVRALEESKEFELRFCLQRSDAEYKNDTNKLMENLINKHQLKNNRRVK